MHFILVQFNFSLDLHNHIWTWEINCIWLRNSRNSIPRGIFHCDFRLRNYRNILLGYSKIVLLDQIHLQDCTCSCFSIHNCSSNHLGIHSLLFWGQWLSRSSWHGLVASHHDFGSSLWNFPTFSSTIASLLWTIYLLHDKVIDGSARERAKWY